MAKVHRFTAEIFKQGVNFLVDVPADVSFDLAGRGYIPVVGTANGYGFRGTMVPAGGGRHRLFLNSRTRTAIDSGEGDTVALVLQQDTTTREPPMPDDFNMALDGIAGAQHRWDGYTPSHRREILIWINDARKPETRARRIARAVAHVMDDM